MKKLTLFTALSLSLFMLASCGKDKKKKNNDITVSGIINPQSCQPQATNGVQMPMDIQQRVSQACSEQRNYLNQLTMQRGGQPVTFSVVYTPNPNGYANPYAMNGQIPQQNYGYPNQNYGYPNQYQGGFYMGGQIQMTPYQQQAGYPSMNTGYTQNLVVSGPSFY